MIRRIFNILSLISAIFLACTLILGAWNSSDDPGKYHLSFGKAFHVCVYGGCVSFFSDEFGPYSGSIIALTSPEWPVERIFSERRAFGYTAGIYYRYFRWRDTGAVLWTLSVSLLYPLVVFAVLPVIRFWKLPVTWFWKWQRARRLHLACDAEFGPGWQMLGVIRLYWWMGVLGATAYLVATIGIGLASVLRGGLTSWESLGQMAICCIFAMAFGTSLHVAHRLATKPEGMLPYARLVGIILATTWFPILTIPGIICVRRVTKHFAAYREAFQAGTRK